MGRSRCAKILSAIIIVSAIVVSACTDNPSEKADTASSKAKRKKVIENFHGWDSVAFRNQYIRMDVVPELGGKIMGYGLHGFQVLWHDAALEGVIDNEQGYGFGERFVNPGGAKVWPAPQGWNGSGEWPGPPDNVLDSTPYDYDFDNTTIVVTSPEDSAPGRTGLQFSHSYSIVSSTSMARLDLGMKNVIDHPVKWSLWHLATVPVDRSATVYAPVDEGDWHVIYGDEDNSQWMGVKDGLFRARYDKLVGKVGLKTREGWVAWHDEENDLVFAMLFPVESGAEYPDGGSTVELWTAGDGTIHVNGADHVSEYSPEKALMEIEVMGPMASLAPGESAALPVLWGVTRCSGVKRVTQAGVVVEELTYDRNGIHGKFGTFYGGDLTTTYYNSAGKQVAHMRLASVSPLAEVVIEQQRKHMLSRKAEIVKFHIASKDREKKVLLGEVRVK